MSGEEYVEMIEIPVNSCEVVAKPKEKKFTVKGLFSSGRIFKRRNDERAERKSAASFSERERASEKDSDIAIEAAEAEEKAEIKDSAAEKAVKEILPAREKKKFKFDIIAAQITAVFVLIAAILVTNLVWADSGMNTLFREVFGSSVQTDTRSHTAFTPSSPLKTGEVTIENGIMKLEKGAVYTPVEGVVSSVTEVNGLYTVTIKHSDVFSTVISGLNYAYAAEGDTVYTGIPVGVADEAGAEVAMYDSGAIVTGYAIENGGIIWEK